MQLCLAIRFTGVQRLSIVKEQWETHIPLLFRIDPSIYVSSSILTKHFKLLSSFFISTYFPFFFQLSCFFFHKPFFLQFPHIPFCQQCPKSPLQLSALSIGFHSLLSDFQSEAFDENLPEYTFPIRPILKWMRELSNAPAAELV